MLEALWCRANGGSDVAADPETNEAPAVESPSAPGADECAEWLRAGLGAGVQRLLFLVGGPGSGKSSVAARTKEGFDCLTPSVDGLPRRTYRYSTQERDLLVINDGTMHEDAGVPADELARDLARALDEGWHVLACLNRGVLVEQLGALEPEDDRLAADLIRWLGRSNQVNERWADSGSTSPMVVSARCSAESHSVEAACVFMDTCSLFEDRPGVTIDDALPGEGAGSISPYRVASFTLRSPSRKRPASILAADILDGLQELDGLLPPTPNPVSANLHSLRDECVRENVLSIMRAAEIASGARFTYRELWGALALSLVGTLTRVGGWRELGRIAELPDSDEPLERWARIQPLAEQRFSQALFGSANPHWDQHPVLRITAHVNPTRDAVPGRIATDGVGGWATPVIEAFVASATSSSSPLEILKESVPTDDSVHAAIDEFDDELDEAYRNALTELADRERDRATRWYGDYLVRLYACANGIPAFRREVAEWTVAWAAAPEVPSRLEELLMTLLLPQRNPTRSSSSRLLPLLESRASPVLGTARDPRLTVRSSHLELRTETLGDELTLKVLEGPKPVGEIQLDFALVREAMSCARGHTGVTDLAELTAPRLERVRASRLTPDRIAESKFRLLVGDDEFIVNFNEAKH